MKILCLADMHIHEFKEFSTTTDKTGNSRLDITLESLEYVLQYCLDNNIRYILVAGDVFHRRGSVSTIVYNATYDIFKRWSDNGLTTVVCVGNHDQANRKDKPENSLYPFRDIQNVRIIDEPTLVDLQDTVRVWCIPYMKDVNLVKSLLNAPPIDNPSILMTHLGVSGSVTGVNSYSMQDSFSTEDLHTELYQYGVLGHYHDPQFIGGTPHFFYCGSLQPHSFSDEGERGFMVIDTDKRYHVEFIPVPCPKFITVTNYKDTDLQLLMGNFVRFIVPSDQVQELLSLIPEGLQYKIVQKKIYEEVHRVDVRIGMSFEQIVTNYADEFNPSAKEIGLQLLGEVQGNVGA